MQDWIIQCLSFRESFRMPRPWHWPEPHPWSGLEHPWSLWTGTLRAQEPASLHFLCIVTITLLWICDCFVSLKHFCSLLLPLWNIINISLSSCGSAQAEAPCYLSSTDLSLPYPYCCPRSICPARLDVHTNLIDTGLSLLWLAHHMLTLSRSFQTSWCETRFVVT